MATRGARERAPSLRIVNDSEASMDERSVQDTCRKETDAIQEFSRLIPRQALSSSLAGVYSFISHLSKWLYRQLIDEASLVKVASKSGEIESALQAACELITSKPGEDITLKAWNRLLDSFGEKQPAIWLQILKGFVFTFEIIPIETRRRLLGAGESSRSAYQTILKAGSSPGRKSSLGTMLAPSTSTNPSPTGATILIRDAFTPVLEELPASRHSALASMCLLLQRDRRNRKLVAAAFGPWLLMEKLFYPNGVNGETSPTAISACADTFEMMIALPEVLFGAFEIPLLDLAAESDDLSTNSGERPKLKPTVMRGSSLRSMLKRFSSSGKDSSAESDERPVEATKEPEPPFLKDSRLAEDLKNRPARSRQSLERVYGRAPPPPPPKSLQASPVSPQLSSVTPPPRKVSPPQTRPPPISPTADSTNEASSANIPLSPLLDKSVAIPTLSLEQMQGAKPQNNAFQEQLKFAVRRNSETRQQQQQTMVKKTSDDASSVASTSSATVTTGARKPPPIPSTRRASTASISSAGSTIRPDNPQTSPDSSTSSPPKQETSEMPSSVSTAVSPIKRAPGVIPPPRSRTPPMVPKPPKSSAAPQSTGSPIAAATVNIAAQAAARRRSASRDVSS